MKLEELGLLDDEILKIRLIAKIFKCKKMTVEDIKLVDKQTNICNTIVKNGG